MAYYDAFEPLYCEHSTVSCTPRYIFLFDADTGLNVHGHLLLDYEQPGNTNVKHWH